MRSASELYIPQSTLVCFLFELASSVDIIIELVLSNSFQADSRINRWLDRRIMKLCYFTLKPGIFLLQTVIADVFLVMAAVANEEISTKVMPIKAVES